MCDPLGYRAEAEMALWAVQQQLLSRQVIEAKSTTPPEVRLAALLKRDLGIDVEPPVVRLFVIANWPKLTVLAHAVHDGRCDNG